MDGFIWNSEVVIRSSASRHCHIASIPPPRNTANAILMAKIKEKTLITKLIWFVRTCYLSDACVDTIWCVLVAGYHPSVGEMLAVVVLLDGAVYVNRVLFDSSSHTAHLCDEPCICIPTR